MLKVIDKSNISIISGIVPDNILKTRILCYALCYGADRSFVDFWCGDGIFVARFEDVYTIWAEKDADYGELRAFIDILQVKNIITSDYVSEALGFINVKRRTAFEYTGDNEVCSGISCINDHNIRKCYELISESIPGSFKSDSDSYLCFLSDFTYRKNRGYARGICIEDDNNILATALTASETPESAIISGISSAEKCRGAGYGKKIVYSIAEILKKEHKKVFVIALNDSAVGFYKHVGFKETEKIAYIGIQ